jgi:anti-sigma B factor antagonist
MQGVQGLQVEEGQRDGATVVRLAGELDLLAVPGLRGRFADIVRRSADDVVLDMCDVTFIDSTGLATMLNVLRRLTRADRRLAIACGEGPVMRMLRLTRLDGTFVVCESAAGALDALGAQAPA